MCKENHEWSDETLQILKEIDDFRELYIIHSRHSVDMQYNLILNRLAYLESRLDDKDHTETCKLYEEYAKQVRQNAEHKRRVESDAMLWSFDITDKYFGGGDDDEDLEDTTQEV